MNVPNHRKQDTKWFEIVKIIPPWLIPIVGLIYGTGVIIVSTFLSTLGLKDTGTFFKIGGLFNIKYLQVGMIYFILSSILIVPPLTYLTIKNLYLKEESFSRSYDITLSQGIIITTLFLLLFCVFVFFAPSGYFHKHYFLVLISVLPVIGLSMIGEIKGFFLRANIIKINEINKFQCIITSFWLITMILITALVIYYYYDIFVKLWEMFFNGGFLYIIFIAVFSLYPYGLLRKSIWANPSKIFIIFLLVTLYYFSIITFGLFIYPFIPADKGGGDYYYAPSVILYLHNMGKGIPRELIDSNVNESFCSKPVRIIDESMTTISVIVPTEFGLRNIKRTKKIGVITIRRECISSISYLGIP